MPVLCLLVVSWFILFGLFVNGLISDCSCLMAGSEWLLRWSE